MVITCDIVSFDDDCLLVKPDTSLTREILQKHVRKAELKLHDGRRITAEQRKKIYATIRDIAEWSGHLPEFLKELLKYDFCTLNDIEHFSLSDCDVSTAREFISFLIDFCFRYDVPVTEPLIERTEDISRYLYRCLEYRKCAICGAKAEVHHVDRVGMGRDREHIVHEGLEAVALCREHHNAAHYDEKGLFKKFHIYGIKLDGYLCKKLNLRGEKSAKIV